MKGYYMIITLSIIIGCDQTQTESQTIQYASTGEIESIITKVDKGMSVIILDSCGTIQQMETTHLAESLNNDTTYINEKVWMNKNRPIHYEFGLNKLKAYEFKYSKDFDIYDTAIGQLILGLQLPSEITANTDNNFLFYSPNPPNINRQWKLLNADDGQEIDSTEIYSNGCTVYVRYFPNQLDVNSFIIRSELSDNYGLMDLQERQFYYDENGKIKGE